MELDTRVEEARKDEHSQYQKYLALGDKVRSLENQRDAALKEHLEMLNQFQEKWSK